MKFTRVSGRVKGLFGRGSAFREFTHPGFGSVIGLGRRFAPGFGSVTGLTTRSGGSCKRVAPGFRSVTGLCMKVGPGFRSVSGIGQLAGERDRRSERQAPSLASRGGRVSWSEVA